MSQKTPSAQDNCAPLVRKEPETGAYTLGYMSGYCLVKLCLSSMSPDNGRQALSAGCKALREAASKEPSIHAEFLKGLDGAFADWTGDYML
jgi:hypothetical protein